MSLILGRKITPADDAGGGAGIAASPDGRYVAIASDGLVSAGVYVWEWGHDGFGARYEPAVGLGRCNGVAWSPDGAYIAVAVDTSPYVVVFPWNDPGFGAKVADPAVLPAGRGFSVAFTPDGSQLIVGHETVPRLTGYAWSAGFGAQFLPPSNLPGSGLDVAVHPSGGYVAAAHFSSPFVTVFPLSGAGFGAKVADPATLPDGTGLKVDFSDDGAALALKHNNSSLTVWAWSAGFGSAYALPASGVGSGDGVAFAPGSTHIALGSNSITEPAVWHWTAAGGFGSLVPSPEASGHIRDIAFTPAGNVLINSELNGVKAYIGLGWIIGIGY